MKINPVVTRFLYQNAHNIVLKNMFSDFSDSHRIRRSTKSLSQMVEFLTGKTISEYEDHGTWCVLKDGDDPLDGIDK